MTIDRIIAAVQRSTHLKHWEMGRDFPELFEVRAGMRQESDVWELRTRLHEILGRCPICDRQFAPCPPAHPAEVPTTNP